MLYLASGSPRRAELLAQIGVPFTVLKAPGIDETVHAGEAPRDYVARMAREKAAAGRAAAPGPEPVLGADTAVVLGERVLGKPDNDDQALAMLRDLQDRVSERLTRPLGLTAFESVWVLTAWCEVRNGFRNFRIDRIRSFAITDTRFPKEPGKEFQDYLKTL